MLGDQLPSKEYSKRATAGGVARPQRKSNAAGTSARQFVETETQAIQIQ